MVRKLLVLLAWVSLGYIVYVTLSPIGLRPVASNNPAYERLVAYAIVGILFGLAYPGRIFMALGIVVDNLVLDTTEEELDRVHAVNFKGVFFGCQAAGRVMVGQRSGSIINIASGAIDMPTPSLVAYSTAKAAVAQLSRTLAMELATQHVRVNAIAPGWIDTPMNERHALRPDGTLDLDKKREYVETRGSKISPMGIPGEPDDIAFAALYLASPAAKFVTGIVMRPNGGSTMPW